MKITWLRPLLSFALVLGSSCSSIPGAPPSSRSPATYSLVHFSGVIDTIADPKNWPGQLQKGRRVDVWLTVDNRSVDFSPLSAKIGSYALDDIPESWRMKIEYGPDFSYRRSTTSPSISVRHQRKNLSGYSFESGVINEPRDFSNHKRLQVFVILNSSLPDLLTSDRLPVIELPLSAFRSRHILINGINRTTGAVDVIKATVDRFEVFQASGMTAGVPRL